MKDDKDTHTVDGIAKKRGRPCKSPERGPMDSATRVALYRARRARKGKTKELTMSAKAWDRIEEIARRKNVTVTEIIQDLVTSYPLPRKA